MTEEIVETLDAAPAAEAQEVISLDDQSNESPTQPAPIERVIPEDPQKGQWRELREALKELKRENQQLRADLTRPAQPVETSDPDESEPYVTPQSLRKKLAALEDKLHAKEAESTVDRLRMKYTDFDDVVSVENVEHLKQHDPELAKSIRALANDPYAQGVAAYKILKKSDHFTNRQTMEDKQKIASNTAKPQSVQTVRKQGALSDANKFANGLTPELKKALWAEMTQARKAS